MLKIRQRTLYCTLSHIIRFGLEFFNELSDPALHDDKVINVRTETVQSPQRQGVFHPTGPLTGQLVTEGWCRSLALVVPVRWNILETSVHIGSWKTETQRCFTTVLAQKPRSECPTGVEGWGTALRRMVTGEHKRVPLRAGPVLTDWTVPEGWSGNWWFCAGCSCRCPIVVFSFAVSLFRTLR